MHFFIRSRSLDYFHHSCIKFTFNFKPVTATSQSTCRHKFLEIEEHPIEFHFGRYRTTNALPIEWPSFHPWKIWPHIDKSQILISSPHLYPFRTTAELLRALNHKQQRNIQEADMKLINFNRLLFLLVPLLSLVSPIHAGNYVASCTAIKIGASYTLLSARCLGLNGKPYDAYVDLNTWWVRTWCIYQKPFQLTIVFLQSRKYQRKTYMEPSIVSILVATLPKSTN